MPPVVTPTPPEGLWDAEAQARLAADGPNELAKGRGRSPLRIILDVLREPMLLLLPTGGLVYLALGDRQEAAILMVFACLSIGITVVQEARTERVLDALRNLSSPRVLVIRGGARHRIAGRDVVRGDLVVLSEGDRVPADARLTEAQDLSADESLLTGEAGPVRKVVGPAIPDLRPGGEDQPLVYSGTLVVRGSALAEVTATGAATEIGRIGASLSALQTEVSGLQHQMHRLVSAFAIAGGLVCLAVVLLHVWLRDGWLEAILAGIAAVGMAMLPEEFPMVLAVFMAIGAWRIAKVRVLTRRASAIETLGAASVLCTDKTGTLTENAMTVAALRLPDGTAHKVADGSLPEAFREIAAAGVLASAPEPFDPMEKALLALVTRDLRGGETPPGSGLTLQRTYPLSPDLLAMSQAWASDDGSHRIAAKGAPEAIAALCRLDADRLCCTNRVTCGPSLSLDRLIPRSL